MEISERGSWKEQHSNSGCISKDMNKCLLFFFPFFQNINNKEISQDWVFFSKEKVKWHRCCLVDSWPVACSKTPDCWYLVSVSLDFPALCLVSVNFMLVDRIPIWTLLGFVPWCWVFQNVRNMMFCILANDAVVVQSGPQLQYKVYLIYFHSANKQVSS